jgi:hypothetical protein
MSSDRLAQLTARADQAHDRYRREFAGRSRIGRDATVLDGLVAQLQQVLVETDSVDGAGALRTTIEQRIAMYRTERTAIAEAQAGGPDVAAAFRLHDWSWMDSRRYARHFAGQGRSTRDLGLMDEMRDGERARLAKLETIAGRHDAGWRADSIAAMQQGVTLYSGESKAIAETRAGLSGGQLAQVLATAANAQFGLYRAHFEGQSRRTRRPAMLKRILGQLEDIAAGMERLQKTGLDNDSNAGNIQKVRDRIRHHRDELVKVKQARANTTAADLSGAYADEANGMFKDYREKFAGRPRKDVDATGLSALCDKILVVAQNMADLHEASALDVVDKNLSVTLDNLKAYEREWSRVQEAQQA